ncbi:hypothetical protein [Puniceibacterium confluentis]|uniref:hypothetical protein n=1 Tax=Puniceibacterium confluentis TaxID=1958944 RepID=UPI0011B5CCA4|nr:hypothetical protein [Puniceibacterium confluentis]
MASRDVIGGQPEVLDSSARDFLANARSLTCVDKGDNVLMIAQPEGATEFCGAHWPGRSILEEISSPLVRVIGARKA